MSMTDLLIRSRVEKTTCPPGTAFSKMRKSRRSGPISGLRSTNKIASERLATQVQRSVDLASRDERSIRRRLGKFRPLQLADEVCRSESLTVDQPERSELACLPAARAGGIGRQGSSSMRRYRLSCSICREREKLEETRCENTSSCAHVVRFCDAGARSVRA